jgi:tRNA pseudouridine13 synthase
MVPGLRNRRRLERHGVRLNVRSRPEEFIVEETLRLQPGSAGDYAVYRATKRLLSTIELQERVASQLGVPPRAVIFPALKDRRAVATQHFSVRGRGPSQLAGEGFTAQFVGRLSRHLAPGDLRGNRFTVTLRVEQAHARAVGARLEELAREGLPNYFDEQRFGSHVPGGMSVGKAILQENAENALRAYLAQQLPGDPPEIREFKAYAAEHWRAWAEMFERAPRSNQRSILTFLKDHPDDFRKGLNLITPRLLPLLLAAYQSLLWNRIASRLLVRRLHPLNIPTVVLKVAGEPLVLYRQPPPKVVSQLGGVSVPLPHHRAAYPAGDVAEAAAQVLEEEGLELRDMKARLLKRAYLPRGSRPLLLFPEEVSSRAEAGAPGEEAVLRLTFFLRPGSYATMLLKVLAATTTPSGNHAAMS